MALNDAKLFNRHVTPQSQPISGSTQVRNPAGGCSWEVDDWTRFDRFLILGAEGGAYYIGEHDLVKQSHDAVVNRNWQAISVRSPQEAFCQMATNVASGLEIEGKDHIRPVTWEERITLPIRDQDEAVQTVRGPVRVPTVIVAVNFAKVPKKRPKLNARTIRERDQNRCQYTGVSLRPEEASLDHVVPRSRGGRDTWENLVWSAKQVNERKADRLPHEAGLRLLSVPRAPREMPVTALIRNPHGVGDWALFIQGC